MPKGKHPRGLKRPIKSNAKVAEEQEFIYNLKLAGYSIRQIAAEATDHFGYNISKSTVLNRIQAEINAKVQPLAEELRQYEVDRLDRYLAALELRIQMGDEKAVNTAVRISESRRKLLGIDAPVQVDVKQTVVTSVDAELEQLAQQLGLHDPSLSHDNIDGETNIEGSNSNEKSIEGTEINNMSNEVSQ